MNQKHTQTENQGIKKLPPEQQLEILTRGTKDFIGRELLLKKLKKLEKQNPSRPLKVKAGFDPSRPDLHLGHSLLINKLRQFQELGHDVIFVVGDWTACIGDPSGQNKTRPALSFEESRKNAQSYKDQACKKNFTFEFSEKTSDPHRHASRNGHPAELSTNPDFDKDSKKIFNFFKRLDPQKTEIVFNSEWFEKLSLRDFVLNIASKCTLARQLERDDFKKRFKENQPIALHELFYPLLQAYDSVELKADVEIGGTDQLFNLLLGRQLQENSGQAPQAILTLPLLKGLGAKVSSRKNWYQKILTAIKKIFGKTKEEDKTKNWNIEGADKMSKSLGNAISFNDSPKDMYGKVLKLSDELLPHWWNLFTEGNQKDEETLNHLIKTKKIHPKSKKEQLAWLLVCSFYGEEQANKQKETFKKERKEKQIPEDILEEPDILSPDRLSENIALPDLLLKLKLVSSKSEARRKILEGAVRILKDNIIYEKNQEKKGKLILRSSKKLFNKNNSNKLLEKKTIEQKSSNNTGINRDQMKKITDPNDKLSIQKNQEIIISLGKRKFKRINTKWNYIHDLKAYLVYRKVRDEKRDKDSLCEELSQEGWFKDHISLSSIKMKIGNYKYLDVREGLSNYSQQSSQIFDKYEKATILEIEEVIKKLVSENEKTQNKEDITKEIPRAQWNNIHDLKSYFIYKKIKEDFGTKNELCEVLSEDKDFKKASISLNSIKMKYENYRYLDTGDGLKGYSNSSWEIYEKYKNYSIAELEQEINTLEAKNQQPVKG